MSKVVLLVMPIVLLTALSYKHYVSAEIVGVFAALELGIVGIFRDWIRSQFFYPQLQIIFEVKPPDCHKTFMRYSNRQGQVTATPDCYYYRMRIENNGSYRAERIEAMIVEKYTENQNGRFEKDTSFLPLIFRWSNDGALRRERIMPSLFRCCNFGYVLHSDGKKEELKNLRISVQSDAMLALDSDMKPNTGSHIILPGKHRVKVVTVGDNTKVSTRIFEIDFRDYWSDQEEEMLKKAVSVTTVGSLT